MRRVVLHYQAGRQLRQRLEHLAADGLAVTMVAPDDAAGLRRALAAAEVLWHVLAPVSAADIAAAPRLRLIQKIGVGVNTIDLDAARRQGVAVCNMPGTNTRAVAEMTLSLMLAALRRLPQLDRAVRDGRGWSLDADELEGCGELGGRTVGLLGYGAVPALLAPVLGALGARVLFTSRSPRLGAVGERVPLDHLLAASDILSLHLPLTAETAGIVDAAALARLRPGAILVNTARGGLVDEAALVAALREGRLLAAGLDVFADEPLPADHPLLRLPNVVLAPHLAWLTAETLERSLVVAIENCRRLGAGMPLLHRVV
jgi:phosphoglycerate dehydrogenase-like enzyme